MAKLKPRSSAGNLIFFDWNNNGTIDYVGVAERCEGGIVYTVEGNSGAPVGSGVTLSGAVLSTGTASLSIDGKMDKRKTKGLILLFPLLPYITWQPSQNEKSFLYYWNDHALKISFFFGIFPYQIFNLQQHNIYGR